MVRAFVVAPAQMHAQPLRRDVGERVVERLDVHAGAFAEVLEARDRRTGCGGPWRDRDNRSAARCRHWRSPRIPGASPRRSRTGTPPGSGNGRCGRTARRRRASAALRKASFPLTAASAALRLPTSVVAASGSRTCTGALHAGVLRRERPGSPKTRLARLGKSRKVLVHEGVAGAAEAGKPILHVGGIARLRHLAVIDDVDAGIGLLSHHLGHRRAHPRRQGGALDRHSLFLGVHHADEVVGPRQAAGVGRQEAIGAAYHRCLHAPRACPTHAIPTRAPGGDGRVRA